MHCTYYNILIDENYFNSLWIVYFRLNAYIYIYYIWKCLHLTIVKWVYIIDSTTRFQKKKYYSLTLECCKTTKKYYYFDNFSNQFNFI